MKAKKAKKSARKSKKKVIITAILSLLGVLILGGGLIGYKYYRQIFNVNVDLGSQEKTYFYIPTGSDFADVKNLLIDQDIIIDSNSFAWLSEKKGYTTAIKPGKYLLTNHMTNNTLINLLRSGRQEPVQFTFNNFRTRQQIAAKAGKILEADSASIAEFLYNDSSLQERYNMNGNEIVCLFIPNTYEFWWNTSATEFLDRMHKEYQKFWNETRTRQAADLGLSPVEVITLASIVDQETKKKDEMSRVAGVYMNRIRIGMPLQADPTVIFAVGDFTIKRVLKSHTQTESPYNTYLNKGLPPGPICAPSAIVIDKVLNCEAHDYLFFCAKEDFSGYHNFAKTNAQHEQNAARYHQAISKLLREKKNKKPAN